MSYCLPPYTSAIQPGRHLFTGRSTFALGVHGNQLLTYPHAESLIAISNGSSLISLNTLMTSVVPDIPSRFRISSTPMYRAVPRCARICSWTRACRSAPPPGSRPLATWSTFQAGLARFSHHRELSSAPVTWLDRSGLPRWRCTRQLVDHFPFHLVHCNPQSAASHRHFAPNRRNRR